MGGARKERPLPRVPRAHAPVKSKFVSKSESKSESDSESESAARLPLPKRTRVAYSRSHVCANRRRSVPWRRSSPPVSKEHKAVYDLRASCNLNSRRCSLLGLKPAAPRACAILILKHKNIVLDNVRAHIKLVFVYHPFLACALRYPALPVHTHESMTWRQLRDCLLECQNTAENATYSYRGLATQRGRQPEALALAQSRGAEGGRRQLSRCQARTRCAVGGRA